MEAATRATDDMLTVTRWVARIIALLLAFVTLIFVSGAQIDVTRADTLRLLEMAAFFIMWAGLLVGWRWEGLGGAMTIGGLVLFFAFDFFFSGDMLRPWVLLIFAIPGALYLACWWQRRHAPPTVDSEPVER